jgi:XRE family transcriptional regulator, regulator of sulfur utilization
MNEPTAIGIRLKTFRQRAKLSQQKLSDLSGVPRTTIASVEVGIQSGLSVENLIRIADVLGVSLDMLARPTPLQDMGKAGSE